MSTLDLLDLLGAYGSDDCNADIDLNGTVGTTDLLQLLSEYGDCP